MAYLLPQSFIFEMTTRDIGTAKRSRQEGKVWKWDLMRCPSKERKSGKENKEEEPVKF